MCVEFWVQFVWMFCVCFCWVLCMGRMVCGVAWVHTCFVCAGVVCVCWCVHWCLLCWCVCCVCVVCVVCVLVVCVGVCLVGMVCNDVWRMVCIWPRYDMRVGLVCAVCYATSDV